MLSILLLGGGGLYWWGLIVDRRIAVLAGAGALGGALILLVGQGGIAPAAFPAVVLAVSSIRTRSAANSERSIAAGSQEVDDDWMAIVSLRLRSFDES